MDTEIRSTNDRKKDHIDLAFRSKTEASGLDSRFSYEPMLTTHPTAGAACDNFFLGKPMKYPIWVSSMTGGTGIARDINRNLARACKDFGLGMGLGSCRKLLGSDEYLEDFAVRPYIGDQPLYANLGIAQVIELIEQKKTSLIDEMMDKIQADGLIVHVNPIQEWLQPEGDMIAGMTPLAAVETLLSNANYKIIVKEVGQGMGPLSIEALLTLPIAALEFGAYGGTNFAKLEALRDTTDNSIDPVCFVGHTAKDMIDKVKSISEQKEVKCREFIISGGIQSYLDGYYYNEILPFNSVYGQASGFLKHAMGHYDDLAKYVNQQTQGYMFAMRYLTIHPDHK